MITLTAGFARFVSPQRSERSALIAIWGVYTIQGQLGGLTFVALPAILRSKHVQMEQIAVFSAIILVWALKFLWAARVERLRQQMMGSFGLGRAIFLAELMIAGLIVGSALISFNSVLPFLAIFSGAAFLASIIDIATDGYLIAHFPPNLRRLGATAQVGGGYLGFALGGSFLPALYESAGWPVSCLVAGGVTILLSAPLLTLPHTVPSSLMHASTRLAHGWRPNLLWALKRREIQAGIAMIIIFDAARRMTQGLGALYLLDGGVSLTFIGAFNGIVGIGAGLMGTVLGNFCVRKSGSSTSLTAIAIVTSVILSLASFTILLGHRGLPLFIALLFLESLVMAAGFVVLFSRVMGLTSPRQPGLDYAVFQSVSAVVAAMAGFAGTSLAGKAGYEASFACATCIALASIPILKLLQKPFEGG
ncbi:hypothetical protein N5W20_01765 [Candidatus Kirkpatrickella diaphorinae]|uniref:MFS transporter n=1 Tax=Candidatus Kirkpatrickella diaphorinae TaxID=2984322 RepID=A0ABY6GLB9_9PROT|nr:hypothetical protein [Candidatus Kirkpatrickella diaphorinae]UYH51625.1 hypothetical protein N5W20_01765 [Candidatus Kirkpatrickella diaphorinae]